MDRREILCAALAAMLGFAAMPAQAQLAEKPVRIVFPYAAGGNGDALSRLVADELRKAINRPVVVENKTGAAGRLGVLEVVKAEKNGDTILITPIAPTAVHQHVFSDLPYNPDKDLVPITQICKFEFAIAVGPEVPAKNLQELVVWMKANPTKASFGSPGAGALPHFFGILFGKAVGVDFVHVGYRGSAPRLRICSVARFRSSSRRRAISWRNTRPARFAFWQRRMTSVRRWCLTCRPSRNPVTILSVVRGMPLMRRPVLPQM